MSELEKLKKNRTVLRTAVTKLINNIENVMKDSSIDFDNLEELFIQLDTKAELLKSVDEKIEPLLGLDDYETEINSVYDYADKISVAKYRVKKKLTENKKIVNIDLNNSQDSKSNVINDENSVVKLPKLNIQKFYGDCTQFISFFNTFKNTIHENKSLSKIEKFHYLKSYLSGAAANAVEGFEISEANYDAALKVLETRYGQKDVIINHHLNKLLNLSPVYKANEIQKLKKLHSDIEINVRCLSTLGLEPANYGSMLIAVILKLIPAELALEYNRQNVDNLTHSDIHKLLDFLHTEIKSREHTFFSRMKAFENNKTKIKSQTTKSEFKSTCEFMNISNDKSTSDRQLAHCIFCNDSKHSSDLCEAVDVNTKRNLLKSQGRCFLCLGRKHVIKNCNSKTSCKKCLGRHNQTICLKSKLIKEVNTPELKGNESETSEKVVSAISSTENNKILLQTCCVKIKSNEKQSLIRLLLDCGSMRTFISEEIANKLNLQAIRKEKLSVFTFGNKNPIEKIFEVVKLTIENKNVPNSKLDIEALVTNQISATEIPPPEINDLMKSKQFENLTLADTPTSKEPITLLIGADYYYDIVTGNIKHLNKKLVAVDTIFGWCLQGKTTDSYTPLAFNVIVEKSLISEQIEKFWNIESSGLFNTKQDSDFSENNVMKQFESEIKYNDKRYTVRFPWKLERECLNDNRKIAEYRFFKLKQRLIKNPELFFEYKEVLADYLKQGIIELVTDPEEKQNVTFYLPHREIIRTDRTTSRLRIVFDASAHDTGSLSLNNCLHVGPNLYPEIFDVLLRFRFNPIAFTTDIKQAFLQIIIDENDRDVTRFLFSQDLFDNSKPFEIYRFTRVLFGISSSPFLLAATIKHHLKKYTEKYPNTVKFLNENIYVDDVIGSHENIDQALSTSLQCVDIFENASMHLHKWHTNSSPLSELWKENGITSEVNSEAFGEQNLPYKVLGIAWNNSKDLLYFDVRGLVDFVSKRIDTKRFILQVLGRIFDPLGFLGPFTLRLKCIIQQIWNLGLDWDDTLPEDLRILWSSWCNELPHLQNFSIPRYYFSDITNWHDYDLQLHIFADSSMKAYGTVAYLRVATTTKDVRTVFVASKNRVAPLKELTLPRLELMAALLSAKLSSNILRALKLNVPTYYWTDSKISYFWIKGSPKKFKTFVRNRIEEIHKLTSPDNWYHCPGTANPADIVSRGSKISRIINDTTWLQGPEWLSLPSEYWPMSENKEIAYSDELQYTKNPNDVFQSECLVKTLENPINISKYSNLEKLLRITVWVKKFIMKLKKSTEVQDVVTTEELLEAENFLIQSEQKQFYKEEIESLKNSKSVDKTSSLSNFMPFIDKNGLMRLGGRLEFSNLSAEEKNPIILPKHSWLTTLIVRQEHEKIMHGGTASTLAKIRSRFWIPKGRQLVKSVIKNCIICKKYFSKPADQITAPLPKDRASEAPPYAICGLDFAGPIYIRNFKETQKSYIVLFTCGVTRAIHLELASDMTTNSFLMAFRRFTARRGNPKIIYSDNAKTFKKAKGELENLYNILTDKVFLNFITKERIIWKNIIERAAWWGGFYERLVKSVKDCLRKVIGRALLSYDELATLLTEVEAVLNTRPLTYVYSDSDEPEPLTPMHFLNFGKEVSFPINFFEIIEDCSKRSTLLKRKKYQSLLLKQLWTKWKKQYLMDLKTAHSLKNPNVHAPLKVGDVVLIQDDAKNKFLWKLGKIQTAIPGRDGNIRSYEIKTASGILKRSIQHLYPFEIQND